MITTTPAGSRSVSLLRTRLASIEKFIGNTPLQKLEHTHTHLYVKLEYANFSGSIKDRAVFNMLKQALAAGQINGHSTIIESSSGNFAIALASVCRVLGLRSIVVIDPNINPNYEKALHVLADEVVKVTHRDETGGFLLNRIKAVNDICRKRKNIFWTNQYENPCNSLAYYHHLGPEICTALPELHYAFVAVSTGGTIAGLSRRLKQHYPQIKIVAVDVEGSVVFGSPPQKRHISGLGSSKVSPLLADIPIDDVLMLSEKQIVAGATALLNEQSVFGGASAGAMYFAAKHYFNNRPAKSKPVSLMLCPDKGTAYLDNIYDARWVKENIATGV